MKKKSVPATKKVLGKTKALKVSLAKNKHSLLPERFSLGNGHCSTMGATLDIDGCNFAVFSAFAKKIELCLFNHDESPLCQIPLSQKLGHCWFSYIKGIKAGQLYGYRVYGENLPEEGMLFDPDKLLIDPYAKAINRPQEWNYQRYLHENSQLIARSVVIDDAFDWQGVDKPKQDMKDVILYELHVRGYTKQHPDVPENHRGTYLGLCNPTVIEHIKALGVTAVQIMPVASFMPESHLEGTGLTNYWGYNSIAFMAPEPRYAMTDPVTEFKTMVRELHRNNIEVILDVVFNHTAEGGHGGPSISLKGLDARSYYIFDSSTGQPNYTNFMNNTGCGNSVNLDHPWVLKLVIDTLRYWIEVMQVDGFRFDLAVSLAREGNEFEPYSAFFKAIFQDPVISKAKLIAEPWDIGPGGYRLGQFPSNWCECNDRYRDTVRGFWKGDHGLLGEFATRILGSKDYFASGNRSPHTSVNYICYHDGFTLEDLVSYQQRHNQVNGEDNRDGHGHNLSDHYGIEGPTSDPIILKLRQKQKRNLIATLMLSQGVPHFLAGDEFGRSQLGNNNAYCQDNGISWVNWLWLERDKNLLDFVTDMIALRKETRLFRDLVVNHDSYYGVRTNDEVFWYAADGSLMDREHWDSDDRQIVAIELKSASDGELKAERWLVLINASRHAIAFVLPMTTKTKPWKMRLDTDLDLAHNKKGRVVSGDKYLVAAHGLVVLKQ